MNSTDLREALEQARHYVWAATNAESYVQRKKAHLSLQQIDSALAQPTADPYITQRAPDHIRQLSDLADTIVGDSVDSINARSVLHGAAGFLRAFAIPAARPTAEPPAPVAWMYFDGEGIPQPGDEMFRSILVSITRQPHCRNETPLYAAAPALLPAPADLRDAKRYRALRDARFTYSPRLVDALDDRVTYLPEGLDAVCDRMVAALGATCPASPERSK